MSHSLPEKILFISRTYPPAVGGMETLSYELIRNMGKAKNFKVSAIVNRQGKKFLPIFFLSLIPKLFSISRQFSKVHLSDAVLAPLGEILKMINPKIKVACTVHGLDLTYGEKNIFYKKINLKALTYLDQIIAVSNSTKSIAIKIGIKKEKICIIPPGINPILPIKKAYKKEDLHIFLEKKIPHFSKIIQTNFDQYHFLFTLGRLTKRKGVAWFVQEVLSKLEKNILYIIAGEGEEQSKIKRIVQKNNLTQRVFLIGQISEQEKSLLFNTIDLFIQPNIKVKNDVEGFGITLLEATLRERLVIATKTDGVSDAIQHKKNGILINQKDASAFLKIIPTLLQEKAIRQAFGKRAKEFTENHFSWKIIIQKYIQCFLNM